MPAVSLETVIKETEVLVLCLEEEMKGDVSSFSDVEQDPKVKAVRLLKKALGRWEQAQRFSGQLARGSMREGGEFYSKAMNLLGPRRKVIDPKTGEFIVRDQM